MQHVHKPKTRKQLTHALRYILSRIQISMYLWYAMRSVYIQDENLTSARVVGYLARGVTLIQVLYKDVNNKGGASDTVRGALTRTTRTQIQLQLYAATALSSSPYVNEFRIHRIREQNQE
jgi:hypothetical protein